ncbi:MAG TPA: tetratricopeptide repeat protein [Pyrinomonadaceae bacterium]|nr:tetratricopeptide repeat protein [Pyrinomonadaceae bacterium]
MGESFSSDGAIRRYLLGRVSDDATLEGLEELLFTDEEFCTRVALAEEELINDYVLGYLNEEDAADFAATLGSNPERRFKLGLTRALREKAVASRAGAAAKVYEAKASEASDVDGVRRAEVTDLRTADASPPLLSPLTLFFRRLLYGGAFAALLVAILAGAFYVFRGRRADELAELRALYGRERPTETRISEFGYAPHAQLRGEPEAREKGRLRLIENNLIGAAERSPNAPEARHALGVFYLTQRKYADAITELESASKSDGGSARIHNDLGATYFELAKTSAREKKLEALGRALEEFTRATEIDANSPEALFNKALAQQELGQPRQARETWALYLRKDSSSPWAEEARRNLARLDDSHVRFENDERALGEKVLADFLEAYRGRDAERARRIHDETKGLLRSPAVAQQLTRRHLSARLGGDDAAAKESLDALAFVGDSERERHSDFFFLNSRTSTRERPPTSSNRSRAPENSSTRASASCSTPAATS